MDRKLPEDDLYSSVSADLSRTKEEERLIFLLENISVGEEIEQTAEKYRTIVWKRLQTRLRKREIRRRIVRWTAIAAGVVLLLSFSHMWVYQWSRIEQQVQIVKLECPYGIRSSVYLPDSTKVTLNGGSCIEYPDRFVGDKRRISLEGEAFFEVTKNPAKPFVVQVNDLQVKVLGTTFNIEGYTEDEQVKVTLETGKVDIVSPRHQVEVRPGEQVIYKKGKKEIKKQAVETFLYSAWRENKFYFRSELLSQIVVQLMRHFNVKIEIISPALKQIRFSGEFVHQENIDEILNIITYDRRINYRRENEKIIIY